MTKIVYKMMEEKTYEGEWNGKVYGGFIYLKGANGGYITINGEESNKKELKLETKYIISKETSSSAHAVSKNGLPTTTESWMKFMEKTEK